VEFGQHLRSLKDLKTAMRLVSGACGYSADPIVMGKDASDALERRQSAFGLR
jgi:hypothetical protein